MGSITQNFFWELFSIIPDSSVINETSGLESVKTSMIIFSVLLSALVTKSPGPFLETCKFSISPKSRIKGFAALIQAL